MNNNEKSFFDEVEETTQGFVNKPGIYKVRYDVAGPVVTKKGALSFNIRLITDDGQELTIYNMFENKDAKKMKSLMKSLLLLFNKFANFNKDVFAATVNDCAATYFNEKLNIKDRETKACDILHEGVHKMLKDNMDDYILVKMSQSEYNGKVSTSVNYFNLPFAGVLGDTSMVMLTTDYVATPTAPTAASSFPMSNENISQDALDPNDPPF